MRWWDKTVGAGSFWMGDGAQSVSAGGRDRVPDSGSSLRSSSAPGAEEWTEDPVSAGSHNQQHLKAVLLHSG